MNSDAENSEGSGIEAENKMVRNKQAGIIKPNSMIITLPPPLSGLILKQTEKKLLKKKDGCRKIKKKKINKTKIQY